MKDKKKTYAILFSIRIGAKIPSKMLEILIQQ